MSAHYFVAHASFSVSQYVRKIRSLLGLFLLLALFHLALVVQASTAAAAPDLQPTTFAGPAANSAGQWVLVSWSVKNQGSGATQSSWYDAIYLSTNSTWDSQDTLLGSFHRALALNSGAVYQQVQAVQLPQVAAGNYYLLLRVDDGAALSEGNEGNNQQAQALIIITPDLTPTDLTGPANGLASEQILLNWMVANQGTGTALAGWYDTIYFSQNNVWDSQDTYLASFQRTLDVKAGNAYRQIQGIQLPQVAVGNYYLIVRTDDGTGLLESNEGNNQRALPFTITAPDLAPSTLTGPSAGQPGQRILLNWTATNQGSGITRTDWYDTIYFSSNAVLDGQDTHLSNIPRTLPLAPGQSYGQSLPVNLPQVSPGNYFLILRTDDGSSLAETNEGNNTRALAISVVTSDLIPIAFTVPNVAPAGQRIALTAVIKNQGAGTAQAGWYDSMYFSSNATWDNEDTFLANFTYPLSVGPGAEYRQVQTLSVPQVAAGNYFLILKTDDGASLPESNENNNALAMPIAVTAAEMIPAEVSTVPGNGQVTLQWSEVSGATAYHLYYATAPGVTKANGTKISNVTSPFAHTSLTNGTVYYYVATAVVGGVEQAESRQVSAKPNAEGMTAPDLSLNSTNVAASANAGTQVNLSWVVQNIGTKEAAPYWYDQVYLSMDDVWDNQDHNLGGFAWEVQLLVGERYTQTQFVSLPHWPAGNYYLIVHADGNQYLAEADESNNQQATPFALTVPDLTPTSLNAPSAGDANSRMELTWIVKNQGTGDTQPSWYDQLYLSTDAVLDDQDTQLGSFNWEFVVSAGQSYTQTQIVNLPQLPAGDYYLILRTDNGNSLYEIDKSNNEQAVPFQLTVPDFQPLNLSSSGAANVGQLIEVTWLIQNLGTGVATPSWSDQLYLSTDAVWDNQDQHLGGATGQFSLSSGSSYTQTQTINLPQIAPGQYYLILRADSNNSIYESNEGNNEQFLAVTLLAPDLQPTSLSAPTSAGVGQLADLSWVIRNLGTGDAKPFWYDRIYLSTNNTWDDQDIHLDALQWQINVGAGASYTRTHVVQLPQVAPGNYFLIIRADHDGYLYESNDNNNALSKAITLAAPDLQPTALMAPSAAGAGQQMDVSWVVKNQGTIEARPAWYDHIFFSTDNKWDGQDTDLGALYQDSAIAATTSYTRTQAVTLPQVPPGNYFLLVRADHDGYLYESNDDNNTLAQAIAIGTPDLVATALIAPAAAASEQQIELSWVVKNQGSGLGQVYWMDRLYLSTDDLWDEQDAEIANFWRQDALAAGASYTHTQIVQLPQLSPGTYHLIIKADRDNYIYETNEANNETKRAIQLRTVEAVGSPWRTLEGDPNAPVGLGSVEFAPDGLRLVAAAGNRALIWDVQAASLRGQFAAHTAQIDSVAFSPGGDQVLSGAHDGTSRIWDAASRQQIRSFASANNQANPAVYSADGSRVLAASGLGLPRLWDTLTGAELRSFAGHTSAVTAVALSPDGTKALAGAADGKAIMWNTSNGTRRFTVSGHTAEITAIAFSPDGTQFLTASRNGTIRLWSTTTGGRLATFIQGSGVVSATFSRDGKFIISAGDSWPGTTYLWDVTQGALVRTFAQSSGDISSVSDVALAPDQSLIATTHSDGQVRLWQSGLTRIAPNPIVPLVIGSQMSLTLQSHGLYYFEVDVQMGRNLLFTLDESGAAQSQATDSDMRFAGVDVEVNQAKATVAPVDPAAVRIIISGDRLPTTYDYQYLSQASIADLHTEIPIAPTITDKYYILIYAPFLTAGSLNATLLAQYVDLHVSDVSPQRVGNVGNVTFTIKGTGFDRNASITLVSPSGQYVNAQVLSNSLRDSLTATFNLRGQEPGYYDLVLQRTSDNVTFTLKDKILVVEGTGGRLKLWLEGPELVRPRRMYNYRLHYENVGDTDIPAPFVTVSTSSSGIVLYAGEYTSTESLVWFASGTSGRGDVLSPGESNFVEFQMSLQQAGTLEAGVVTEDNNPFAWDYAEQQIRPPNIADPEWSPIWSQITTEFGDTRSEVFQSLREMSGQSSHPILLDDLIRGVLFGALFQDSQPAQVASVIGENPPVDTYTLDTAWTDVTLYDRSVDDQQTSYKGRRIFPDGYKLENLWGRDTNVPVEKGATFNPALPTIFVTHGWHGGHSSENVIDLVRALARHYPAEQYNIVRLVWDVGAETPPSCLVGSGSIVCGANQVSERADLVATIARIKLAALGFTQWDKSIFVGHSFGNAVNAYMVGKACRPTRCGIALLLNPASSGGYNLGGTLNQPDYTSFFRQVTAIYTPSHGDQWKRDTMANVSLLYEAPDCGGKSCNGDADPHNSASRLITCFLGGDGNREKGGDGDDGDGKFSCGNIDTSQALLARRLVEGHWKDLKLVPDELYFIDATGRIYTKAVDKVYCYHGGYCQVTYRRTDIEFTVDDQTNVRSVRPIDPNDKEGPLGIDSQRLIASAEALIYIINFENLASATAPVQELTVVDYLDPNLDWTTLQFGEVAYGPESVMLPNDTTEYTSREIPSSPVITGEAEGQLAIDISASLNPQTGRVEWRLKVIDTATGTFPEDPLAGFLPPEDGTGRGMGHVSFSIRPRADVEIGTRIANKASIVFDTNDPIETNEVWNTIGVITDLALGISATPDPAVIGSPLTYAIAVHNDGPVPATNVVLNSVLPAGVTYVPAVASQGTCSGKQTVTCNLGTINPGARATVEVVVIPTAEGALGSSASVTTSIVESNNVNNSVTFNVIAVKPGEGYRIYVPTISRNAPSAAAGSSASEDYRLFLPVAQDE